MRTRTQPDMNRPYSGEYFTMPPEKAPDIGKIQADPLTEQAFSAEADAQNGEFSQNTTAWD